MVALICGILALVCYLVALLGWSIGVDPVTVGHVFVAATLVAMNLPPRMRR